MSSKPVLDRVERFRAAAAELLDLPLDVFGVPDLLAVLDATETVRCQTPVIEHEAINRIAAQATPEQIGGSLKKTLAARLRIRPGEARRRIADAEMLGTRTTLTGEPLAPLWTATAAGQRAGDINSDHVAEIAPVLSPAAVLGGRVGPRTCRSGSRGVGGQAPPRRVAGVGRQAARLPQPRRQLHRRRPRPPARHHHRAPRHRRHVQDQRLAHPRSARQPGRRIGEVGGSRDV